MKKRKKRILFAFGSISTSLIYAICLLSIAVIALLSLLSYRFTIQDSHQRSVEYTERLIGEMNDNIDTYISNMKSVGRVIVENSDVRSLLKKYDNYSAPVPSDIRERVCEFIKVMADTHDDIVNIALVSRRGHILLSDSQKRINSYSEYNIRDWYLKPLSYIKDTHVSKSHVQNLIEGEYKWVISVSQAIIDPESGMVTGVVVIDLNYKVIQNICEKKQLGKSGYMYLIDSLGGWIYHPQQQLVYSGIKNEPVWEILKQTDGVSPVAFSSEDKIYLGNKSALTGWYVVGVVNSGELVNTYEIISFYLLIASIIIPFAVAVAVLISLVVTKPIKKLESTMKKVEHGDLSIRSNLVLNNEIGHLSNTFNKMIDRTQSLMDKTVAVEKEKRISELKALQAQINPHFLYNTLESIIWMSAAGKNDEVVEMTSALSKLFRTSIGRRGDDFVSLMTEEENIRSYLTIQKMRYRDKLEFSLHLPEELKRLRIPKLLLQPIVENAIYHGIKPSPKGGTIKISFQIYKHMLKILISDSGLGMTAEQLKKIFDRKEQSEHGIGVLNVQNRIKLFFGEEYGLTYSSESGAGTQVEITLPIIETDISAFTFQP